MISDRAFFANFQIRFARDEIGNRATKNSEGKKWASQNEKNFETDLTARDERDQKKCFVAAGRDHRRDDSAEAEQSRHVQRVHRESADTAGQTSEKRRD